MLKLIVLLFRLVGGFVVIAAAPKSKTVAIARLDGGKLRSRNARIRQLTGCAPCT